MYQQDSFFDLTPWGQVGLAFISLTLFTLMVVVAHRLLWRAPFGVRVLGAFILFYVYVWVSPQVYYMYYRMVIPDLPLQWVIWPPPEPARALKMLMFQWRENLSAHGQGLLGWGILIAPWLKTWRARSSSAHGPS
ncbi:MAG: hypothetical protein ABJJ53_16495 [Sulfitobacter sp.]